MTLDNRKAYEYLKTCLKYYDDKSKINKRWYAVLIAINILLSSFIPFVTLFIDDYSSAKYIVALMGCIVTAASSCRVTFGFHENWIEYRTSSEILRYHKYLYQSNSTPYNNQMRDEILISNVNAVVETENKTWRINQLNMKPMISDHNTD